MFEKEAGIQDESLEAQVFRLKNDLHEAQQALEAIRASNEDTARAEVLALEHIISTRLGPLPLPSEELRAPRRREIGRVELPAARVALLAKGVAGLRQGAGRADLGLGLRQRPNAPLAARISEMEGELPGHRCRCDRDKMAEAARYSRGDGLYLMK